MLSVSIFFKLLESIDPAIGHRRIVAACSGGPDSGALVMLLSECFKTSPERLGIAHVNYHLRGEDSELDEQWVRQLAQISGITYHGLSCTYRREDGNLQAWARRERMLFFDRLAQEHGYQYIALGHNRDDQAETIVDHLTRGSGLTGLCGMKPKDNRIIRPLLSFSREEILHYLEQHGYNYRIDQSNFSLKYHRNRIRHRIMPALQELNSRSSLHISRSAGILQQIDNHLTRSILDHTRRHRIFQTRDLVKFRAGVFSELPQSLWSELVRQMIRLWNPLIQDIQHHQIQSVIEMIRRKSTFRAELTRSILIQKNRDYILIGHPPVRQQMIIPAPGEYQFMNRKIRLIDHSLRDIPHPRAYLNPYSEMIYIKMEPSLFPLRLTNDYRGLIFRLPGSFQPKKMGDLMRDRRIGSLEKSHLICLAKENEVIYFEHGLLSGGYRIDSSTAHYLTLHITEENL